MAELNDPKEKEINWEELRVGYLEKIKAWAEANGKQMTDDEIEKRANYEQNFHQYFLEQKNGKVQIDVRRGVKDGFPVDLSDEENETRTMLEWKRGTVSKEAAAIPTDYDMEFESASGPIDFFSKNTEKFFGTTVNQFLGDLHRALGLAGVTEEEYKKDNVTPETKKKWVKAITYLVDQGYNARDIIC